MTGSTRQQELAKETVPPTRTDNGTPAILAIDNLTVGYHPSQAVLRGLTLRLTAPGTHVILGNPTEITALIDTLTGLLVPWSGCAIAGGIALTGDPRAAAEAGLTIVGGTGANTDWLTTDDLPAAPGRPWSVREILAACPELDAVLYRKLADVEPSHRYLLAIARALLLTSPRILLLHNPPTALPRDSAAARSLLAGLTRIAAHPVTVLIATSDPMTAGKAGDHIHVIADRRTITSARRDATHLLLCPRRPRTPHEPAATP